MNWFGVLTSKSRCKMEWCRFPFRSHSWCRNGEARVFFGTRKGIRPEKLCIRPLVRNFKCGTVWPRFTWKMAIKTVCMCAYWLKWHFCANVAVAFCRVRTLIASHALRYWDWQHKQVKWTACVGLVADDHGSQSLGQCYSSVCVCARVFCSLRFRFCRRSLLSTGSTWYQSQRRTWARWWLHRCQEWWSPLQLKWETRHEISDFLNYTLLDKVTEHISYSCA